LRVGLDVLEHLRLEEKLGKAFFLDGIVLDNGDDIFFEVGADVAEPLGEIWGGWPKSSGTLATTASFRPFAGGLIVDGGEGFIHPRLFSGELTAAGSGHFGEGFLGVLAENQPPALWLLFI